MGTYAAPETLADELGTVLDDVLTARYTRWLGAVEARIRRRIPTLDAKVTSGAIDRVLLEDICVAVAARHARNTGIKSIQTQVDDASARRDFFQETSPRFELTDEEWALLLPNKAGGFSILIGWPSDDV